MKSAVFFAKGILEIYENWWSLSRHRAVSFFIKRRLSLHDHQFISKKLPLGKSTFKGIIITAGISFLFLLSFLY
jgi:hypothetical protein